MIEFNYYVTKEKYSGEAEWKKFDWEERNCL